MNKTHDKQEALGQEEALPSAVRRDIGGSVGLVNAQIFT
jgi:hypothetical protein